MDTKQWNTSRFNFARVTDKRTALIKTGWVLIIPRARASILCTSKSWQWKLSPKKVKSSTVKV